MVRLRDYRESMTFEQSDEEVVAHIAGDAVQLVQAWIDVVFAHQDWFLAFGSMTAEGRLSLISEWLTWPESPDLDQLEADRVTEALARLDVEDPHWDLFAEQMLEAHSVAWGDLPDNIGFGSRPRIEDLQTEVVALVDMRDIRAEPTVIAGHVAETLTDAHPPVVQFEVRHLPEGGVAIAGWKGGPSFSKYHSP